tara:strand:- start:28 stop:264 length:237 start_codon:yes stop_codon:yes gene_type:complete
MGKELVVNTKLKRKNGKLYYLDKDGDICEGIMCGITQHNPPKYQGGIKVLKLGIQRVKGFLYFVGKDGNVYRTEHIEK